MNARFAVASAAVLLALASCQSTEPILFIATPGYVENQLARQEASIRDEYDARIAELEAELDEQRTVSDELAGLSQVIRDVESSTRELEQLAAQVEDELAGLPEETIRIIVDVLTRHLDGEQGQEP